MWYATLLPPPPPRRKFEIIFALRRIGILAGFAVCILTFAATDAQAQTSCEAGERAITNASSTGCFPNAAAALYDDCIAAGWSANLGIFSLGELACDIPTTLYEDDGGRESGEACNIHGAGRFYPDCTLAYGNPPQFLKKADFPDLGGNDYFVVNCSRGGTIPGAIPPGMNMNGETECTCDSASGYVGNWPDCVKCSDNHTIFGGVCIPDSGDDFGELSDAVLCKAFGGKVLQDSLPQEAQNLISALNIASGSAAEKAIYRAMASAIQAKFRGDTDEVNTFLSRYDTGGTHYNADVYSGIDVIADAHYGGSNTFSGNNLLEQILDRVSVRDPDKCVGANNSDALCVLDDEADSAGVLPCQEQFPPLWACRNAGWSFSINNGGSCGVLLTLAGGTTSDQCHLSGSASPQCADVFASTVHYFPSPTLAADGATLRFVYNCDPDGESGLIPATANTIAATECGCESGASFFSDVCISEEGDLGLSDELLCGAFGGTVRTATGGREVCSGMDANDTFCIMDSAVGFPCRGLFKHLRSCNLEFNRKALNPFFCGENCGVQKAVGSECR